MSTEIGVRVIMLVGLAQVQVHLNTDVSERHKLYFIYSNLTISFQSISAYFIYFNLLQHIYIYSSLT